MLALFIALLATIILTPEAVASGQYTVWSSVIFARSGERTPEVLGYIPTTLTSYGANQAHDVGSFFRERYISSAGSPDSTSYGPLQGLSANTLDSLQLYFHALDEQYTMASAQAFVQGLYPPFTLNASVARLLDPTSILANSSYVESPLQGYQYAEIHNSGGLDAAFPYIGGSLDCPAFDTAALQTTNLPDFALTQAAGHDLYQEIGQLLLSDVLDSDAWDYFNAYAIYDYLNYLYAHNSTAKTILDQQSPVSRITNASYIQQLRWYADSQQYSQLGNLTATNNYSGTSQPFAAMTTGSISTIAGNMLAAKLLSQLQIAIATAGDFYKLSVLFGDFEPLLSFFALARLPELNSNFYGIPDFGSVIVFELFSYTNSSMAAPVFPGTEDLWVRFWFRNGTGGNGDVGGNFQSYPIFGRGPSETDMTWKEFEEGISEIAEGDIGTWCTQCGAQNLFCAAWNSSDALTSDPASSSSSSYHHHYRHGMKPAVAGVVGAIITLAFAALIFAAAMLIGGLRFHRVENRRKNEMGGFKGGHKMASDKDLTITKGGATVVGASIDRSGSPVSAMGNERVGSWELKQKQSSGHMEGDRKPSFESEMRIDPFRDPVKADERV
ncbi:hypothetical protein LTR78_009948 [Recurvomyces mirabilis]|uniref:Phosphoglycerate mutase-like protein n=1 Tax=Recurvomyces mirabilis TaxID=574656 RepID=A0AAE0WH60_9PEZI|nr:hypothetical protein LTR78_009948 [Recurvomyces mirabilis]KAK5160380.1 hypothetical protein LTS14_001392 [Recurvomyces mirabilis]